MSSWFMGSGSPSRDNKHKDAASSSPSSVTALRSGPSIHELLPHLYPQQSSTDSAPAGSSSSSSQGGGSFWEYYASSKTTGGSKASRFSTLLLEHGEQAIQDWAVVAYTAPWKAGLAQAAAAANTRAVASSTTSQSGSSSNHNTKILWAQSPQTPPVTASGKPVIVNNHNNNNASATATATTTASSTATVATPLRHMSSSITTTPRKTPTAADLTKDEYPTVHMTKIKGRLFLCTRSLVLEPEDPSRGVIRFPWSRMEAPTGVSDDPQSIQLYTHRHVVMKVHNVLGPFDTIQIATKVRFTLQHSSPQPLLDLAQRLYHATTTSSSLSKHTHASAAEAEWQAYQTQLSTSSNVFDMDNLVHVVREQLLLPPVAAQILTPLQSQQGVLVLTSAERLYFQPGHVDIAGGTVPHKRAVCWNCSDLVATARRYHGLRDSALELYWKSTSGRHKTNNNNVACSTLLAFERRHDREQVLRLLPRTATCVTDRDFLTQVVQQWLEGTVSNYDYLLALNSAAGRSFHDLSRYPVVPWVVADYTSDTLDLENPQTFRDLSKPVGALNPTRLDYFQQRLANMQDLEKDPFLFGTHYSAPAYVLYYLVRTMPEHMLCLQNGKFDAADRMFYSIEHCYQCCLTNHADVKELIPQFYSLDKFDVDFLRNARNLSLGATQTGERVHDVLLPPWAERSPRKFVQRNRQALESTYVKQQLPAWIDLIFGVRSRGDAARQANNLFHRMSYLGPRELADASPDERATAELQATEFGIVPDQLFQAAHPLQINATNANDAAPVDMEALLAPHVGRASSLGEAREAWELLDSPSASSSSHLPPPPQPSASSGSSHSPQPPQHSALETTNSLPLRGSGESSSGTNPFEVPHDVSRTTTAAASPPRPALETMAPQAPAAPAPVTSPRTAWDLKMLERRAVHSDCVSGCVLLLEDAPNTAADTEPPPDANIKKPQQSLLVTTSLDGGLMVHKVSLNKATPAVDPNQGTANAFSSTLKSFSYSSIMSRSGQGATTTPTAVAAGPAQSKLSEYRTHSSRDPLASLVVARDGAAGHVAFAGGHDDVVLAYGINSACAVASVYSHRDAVTGLDLIARPVHETGPSALWLDNSTHVMVSGSWDATVKVWSASVSAGETVAIHREPLAELFDADSSIVSVSACAVSGLLLIAAGCADGSLCVWNIHNDGVQVIVHKEPPSRRGSGPCSSVQWVRTAEQQLHLFAAFSTGKVASFSLVDNSSRLVSSAAVSVGVGVLSMVYSEGMLLVGCSDGGLRLIPVVCRPGNNHHGFYFDQKPTMWKAVHNKAAPGICSISITYAGGRCICCTGAEDGSVALFELKQT